MINPLCVATEGYLNSPLAIATSGYLCRVTVVEVDTGNGGKDVYLRLQQDDEEVMILIASFLPMLDRQA